MKNLFTYILSLTLIFSNFTFAAGDEQVNYVPYDEAIANLNDGQDLVLPLFSQRESYQGRIDLAMHPDNRQLDVLTFTLNEDSVGFTLLAAALEIVKRGGTPRIGYDAFSSKVSPELQAYMREKGVDLRSFRPMTSLKRNILSFLELGLLRFASFLNMRTHDKVFTTKHGTIVGSSNYSKYYYILGKLDNPKSERNSMWAFLDREILIQGPAEQTARNEFDKKWAATKFWSTGPSVELTPEIRAKYDAAIAKQTAFIASVQNSKKLGDFVSVKNLRYVTDVMKASEKKKMIHHNILKMIKNAKTDIIIENPYVLLPDDVMAALQAAKARGVRVRIYTNKAEGSDEGDVSKQFKVDMRILENKGFEVFLNDYFYIFHGKVVVVDQKEIYWGSYNFDPRSKNFNSENGVFFESKDIAARIDRRTQTGIFVPIDIQGQGPKSYNVKYLARTCAEVYKKQRVETVHMETSFWGRLMMRMKAPLL
ncbi:MAG: phosphatidylserine/phosphatidylglycerophosphate/cardiolipin synthase family protein [Bdellovibrionaceae bacterium]|nr:phosphatidylserine/phosphatidylglycerophosphate/cardiolipin synthase family protein [Pseudobdellovibrionaceae bacterium]